MNSPTRELTLGKWFLVLHLGPSAWLWKRCRCFHLRSTQSGKHRSKRKIRHLRNQHSLLDDTRCGRQPMDYCPNTELTIRPPQIVIHIPEYANSPVCLEALERSTESCIHL